MSDDTLSVADVVRSDVQIASRLWTQAFNTITICPTDQLRTKTDGDSTYLLTPSTSVKLGETGKYNFSIAALVDKRRMAVNDDSQLFLVVDDNVIIPAFTLGKRMFDKTASSTYDSREVAASEVEKIIGFVKKNVDELKSSADRAARDLERTKSKRRDKIRKRTKIGVCVAGIPAVIAGVVVGIVSWVNSSHEQDEQIAAQRTAQYDAQNVVLRGTRVTVGDLGFAINDPNNMGDGNIPVLDSINAHVRSLSVSAGDCHDVGHIAVNETVLAASDAPDQSVIVSIDSNGDVGVCAKENKFATVKDSQGKVITPTYKVLIQSQPAK